MSWQTILAPVLIAASGVAAVPPIVQIPLASNHFTNPDYGFAVEIPPGLMGCVSDEGADHGVSISLERDLRCESYRRKPHVDIYAEYNMPGDAKTPLQRARIECPDRRQRK